VLVERVDGFTVIHIPEGENKPHSSSGQFYLRIGSTSQQLRRDEIRDFFQRERLVRFDETPNPGFDFKHDFYRLKFNDYLERANLTSLRNEMDTLRNLNLLDGDSMRNAGVLFFTQRITKFFMSAVVVCVLYEGTDKHQILDMKEFNADIISNFENALNYTRSKLNTNLIIKAERTNRLELPEEALREALVNAIVHRDYVSTGHVQVDIYLDRVDISNPGGLVSGLERKDLGKRSMPRNPLLMDLLLRIDKVERVGSGIGRIRKAMKGYGLSAKFNISKGWFSVAFPRSPQGTPLFTPPMTPLMTPLMTPPIELSPLEKKIYDALRNDPKASSKILSTRLSISQDTVKEYLEKLKAKGAIRRIGSARSGHWEVIKRR
jgi:ATP-dependent DNA helicase RecG